ENITPREIRLDQGHLLNREGPLILVVHGTAKGFQARHDVVPGVLRQLLLRRVVGKNDQLNENIPLVTESEVAKRGFRVPAGGSLRNLQRAADLVELGRGTLGQLEL